MRTFAVATGGGTKAKRWTPLTPMTWTELLDWLALDSPASVKECGAYFLGELTGGLRRNANLVGRSALTLDADTMTADQADVMRMALDLAPFASLAHTTHSSKPEAPRLRIIVPLARDVTGHEYKVISGYVRALLSPDESIWDISASRSPLQLMLRPAEGLAGTWGHWESAGDPLDPDILDLPPEPPEHVSVVHESEQAEELHPDAQRLVATELERLDALVRDGWAGELWDDTTYAVACNLVEIGNSPWAGYLTAEEDFLAHVPAREEEYDPALKWDSALRKVGAGNRPAPADPRDEFEVIASPPGGWTPADIAALLAGTLEPLVPTLLVRSDGLALLYRGRTHSIAGESGGGKSWVAMWGTAGVLKSGGSALYVDYESNVTGAISRLRNLGCPDADLARLVYVAPSGVPRGEEFEALLKAGYDLVVIDGVTQALSMSGIGGESLTNNNDALTRWHNTMPERFARETGAAVLMVDHVTKARDGRGGFAIGGQAKRANVSGAAYTLDVLREFGRGRDGSLAIHVNKDREGHVVGKLEEGTTAGIIRVTSLNDAGDLLLVMDPPAQAQRKSDAAREAVLDFLASLPPGHEGVGVRMLRSGVVGHSNDAIGAATDALVAAGHVDRWIKGQSILHKLPASNRA